MNIFVCVKQVPDTETKVVPTADGTYIETEAIKWIVNPYDEFAIEQALLLKADNGNATVTALRVGGIRDTEALRTALAMGVDRAILVEAPDNLDSYMAAKALNGALEKSEAKPDIIFTGKQAIDDDCLQVPGLLAQMLGIPSVCVVTKFACSEKKLTLEREIEGGAREVYEVDMPALVACNKGLNTPRFASLIGLRKAKNKEFIKYSLDEVGVSESDRKVIYSEFQFPPEKPPGKKFDASGDGDKGDIVKEVVGLLRNEAKVI